MQGIFIAAAATLIVAAAPARAAADPADPRLPVPEPGYTSVFADYRSARDGEALDWRNANQAVASGGALDPASAQALQPAADGAMSHGHHHGHHH